MTDLHFFGGEKGGVGKSLICQCAANYLLEKKIGFKLFDGDVSSPDVKRNYSSLIDCKEVSFSEQINDEDAVKEIFNSVEKVRVLINLPPQVQRALGIYLTKNRIFEFAQEKKINLYMWFVSDGSYDSLQLLYNSLRINKNFKHIVVKNNGLNKDWDFLESDNEFQYLLRKNKVNIINLPKLYGPLKQYLDYSSLPFMTALQDNNLTVLNQSRLWNFLQEIYKEFERIEIFRDKSGVKDKEIKSI